MHKERHNAPKVSGEHDLVLHPSHLNDFALWKAFRSGDEKAFITIFDRFNGPMFNYGYKMFADSEQVKDAIQELFIGIWKKRSRLGDTDSIKSYLYKSLRRKLARIKTKAENRLFITLSDDAFPEGSPSPEFILVSEQISAEQKDKVAAMLNSLTRRQKEALFLRYFDELSCDQIALVMDLNKQTVYNIIYDAVRQLRKISLTSS